MASPLLALKPPVAGAWQVASADSVGVACGTAELTSKNNRPPQHHRENQYSRQTLALAATVFLPRRVPGIYWLPMLVRQPIVHGVCAR